MDEKSAYLNASRTGVRTEAAPDATDTAIILQSLDEMMRQVANICDSVGVGLETMRGPMPPINRPEGPTPVRQGFLEEAKGRLTALHGRLNDLDQRAKALRTL